MSIEKYVKTTEEIKKMRVAGKLAAEVLMMIVPYVKKGITTLELNDICHDYIVNTQKAIPAPLNYRGFPKSICTSVNHVICHGIPKDKVLKDGDIVNIDVTVIKDGYHGDTSRMYFVGKPSIAAQKVVEVAQKSLYAGIKMVKPGLNIRDIGKKVSQVIKPTGYTSVEEYCGHGIGSIFHEPGFQILHYDEPNQPDIILQAGHTFTIEPMINVGAKFTKLLADDWTVITKDHSLSAQWEHTLLVTETGCDILTLRDEEDLSKIFS